MQGFFLHNLETPVAEQLEFLQADNFFVDNDGGWGTLAQQSKFQSQS